jgi:hypothetical protein
LRGLSSEDVAEAIRLGRKIAADPDFEVSEYFDVHTREPFALIVEMPDERGA